MTNSPIMVKVTWPIFTTRRYASAVGLYDIVVCSFVRPSQAGIFGTKMAIKIRPHKQCRYVLCSCVCLSVCPSFTVVYEPKILAKFQLGHPQGDTKQKWGRLKLAIFTSGRSHSAVYAVVVCPSVRPSVCLRPILYQNG